MADGWPEDKKGAVPYSSDSNLDVNCRLMSRRSGMLLGNHSGIQENEANNKKKKKDRCTTERSLNRAVVLSALSTSHTTEHGRRCMRLHCHTERVQSQTPAKTLQQLLLPTANSLFFLLLSLSLSCTHSHTNASPPSFSFSPPFHLFLFLRALPLPPPPFHRPTSGQLATVPGPRHHICW